MNEKREQLNIFAERGTPVSKIEREAGALRSLELFHVSDRADKTRERTELTAIAVPYTRFETSNFTESVDAVEKVEKLTSGKRVEYALYGTGWTIAALAAFALNSVVLVFDGGLLNIFFTTAGYLAYKQFKAAITGTPNVCLEFKCTNSVIKDRIGEIFAYIKTFFKNLFSKKTDCIDCLATA